MRLRQASIQIAIIAFAGLLLCLNLTPGLAQTKGTGNPQPIFNSANAAYTRGAYPQAIELYQQLLGEGWQSGPLYYNLGNAYFKNGQTGKAVVYFEKAKRLIPGDADLKANLAHVTGSANSGTPRWQTRLWETVVFAFSLEQAWVYTSICLFILAGVLIGMILWPERLSDLKPWPQVALSLSSGALIAFLSIAVCTGMERSQPAAVAIREGGQARFEPTAQATLRFNLAEGVRVVIREQRNGWSLVERRDGIKGWVQDSYLERI